MPEKFINLSPGNYTKINPFDVDILDDEEKKNAFESSFQNFYKSLETIQGSPLNQVEKDALFRVFMKNANREKQMSWKEAYKEVMSLEKRGEKGLVNVINLLKTLTF